MDLCSVTEPQLEHHQYHRGAEHLFFVGMCRQF